MRKSNLQKVTERKAMDTSGGDFSVTRIISVVERMPDANWHLRVLPRAGHYILCVALSGSVYYSFGKDLEPESAKAGDVMLFSDRMNREGWSCPENPWHFISITFDVTGYGNDKEKPIPDELPWRFRGLPPQCIAAFQELQDKWMGRKPAYMLKCRSLLEGILYEMIRFAGQEKAGKAQYERIESIRQYIQDHCTQNLSVQELARKSNYSPSHFRTLFKEIVGMTATQYLALVRVYKARDYLLSGEMNVSEAAEKTGYKDIFYFSRQFHQITGHAPSYYLK